MPTEIWFHDTCTRIAALRPGVRVGDLRPTGDLTCRVLPGWVSEFGVVRCDDDWMVWLGRDPEAPRHVMEQAVLDVPAGRYLVDAYDVSAQAWQTRESAATSPLVIGVPASAGAVLLLVREVVTGGR